MFVPCWKCPFIASFFGYVIKSQRFLGALRGFVYFNGNGVSKLHNSIAEVDQTIAPKTQTMSNKGICRNSEGHKNGFLEISQDSRSEDRLA